MIMVLCSFKVYQQVRKRYRATVHPKINVIGVRPMEGLIPVTVIDDRISTSLNVTTATNISGIGYSLSSNAEVSGTNLSRNEDGNPTGRL